MDSFEFDRRLNLNACVGCEGEQQLEAEAAVYLHGPSTKDFLVIRDDGGEHSVIAFTGGTFDLPRHIEVTQIGELINEDLLADTDPLRCSNGCILMEEPASELFQSVVAAVKKANLIEFKDSVRLRSHLRSIKPMDEGGQISPNHTLPQSDSDLMTGYIDEILPIDSVDYQLAKRRHA